ncbi:MAG TPA: PKD domain-containing protein, partial [Thermoplasmatales archaeon]|nr:PKD domain-containing protein [Thermoplasmatales archaeon]
ISDNTISGNSIYGIDVWAGSSSNMLYRNTFTNNGQNAKDQCTNTWYNPDTHEGNYWDDYTGQDTDGDERGDEPYPIPGGDNQDIYVLGFFEEPEPPQPPQNKVPVADAGGPYYGMVNQTVYFDGSGSYDTDGNIVSYIWDFGDGSFSTGKKVQHIYSQAGNYTVTLTVRDDDGGEDIDTTTACISDVKENNPPVAVIDVPSYAMVGEKITFDASNSYDSDGTIVSYVWSFGDGNNAVGSTVEHSYSSPGTYTITLTVNDDLGGTGTSTATITIFSQSEELIANAGGPYEGDVGYSIEFNASGSAGNIVQYIWDFGDGTTLTTENISCYHYYAEEGIYNVTLTVVDVAGRNDTSTTYAIISKGWEKKSPGFEIVLLILALLVLAVVRRLNEDKP